MLWAGSPWSMYQIWLQVTFCPWAISSAATSLPNSLSPMIILTVICFYCYITTCVRHCPYITITGPVRNVFELCLWIIPVSVSDQAISFIEFSFYKFKYIYIYIFWPRPSFRLDKQPIRVSFKDIILHHYPRLHHNCPRHTEILE